MTIPQSNATIDDVLTEFLAEQRERLSDRTFQRHEDVARERQTVAVDREIAASERELARNEAERAREEISEGGQAELKGE